MKRIGCTLGIERTAVRRWLRSDQLPPWDQYSRGSPIDAYADYLRQR
jgi:hypothetical protein